MTYSKSIKLIARRILEDRCVIVCGSELSALANESYANNRISEAFMLRHRDCFPETYEEDFPKANISLPLIIQRYINTPEEYEAYDQSKVNAISKNFLRQHFGLEQHPSTAHMILVNLGCKYIFTTNYDTLIETAYYKAGFPKESIAVISCNETGDQSRYNFPHVYKICGTANERNILLTERQFRPGKAHLGDEMRLRFMHRTILFIGYNKNDNIMLDPFVTIIRNSSPEDFFCVTQPASLTPDCLTHYCLGGGSQNSVNIEIGDFFSQLYMELLSQTYDLFGYLSLKRKVTENSAILFYRDKPDVITDERIRDVQQKLQEHKQSLAYSETLGSSWYKDFIFHQSIYEALPIDTFANDFTRIYLKLRVFFSAYQSRSTTEEHEEIYRCFSTKDIKATARNLNRHLRNVSETARFWLHYYNVLNRDIFREALLSYQLPLVSEDNVTLDESLLKEHNKVLVLGEKDSGKTSYSVRQVVLAITTGNAIPIYVNFKSPKFNAEIVAHLIQAKGFHAFLCNYFKLLDVNSKMMSKIIDEKIQSGGFLLILDGIDVLPPDITVKFLARIRSYYSESYGLKVIITSKRDSISMNEPSERLSELFESLPEQTHVLPILHPVRTDNLNGEFCTLAIVFVDIAGSTTLEQKLGAERFRKANVNYISRIEGLIEQFRGEKLRQHGDEHLAVFWNAGLALDYVLALQLDSGDPDVRIRAGIHVGEVQVELGRAQNDRISGISVNFAKRVEQAIERAEEIWLSNAAKEQINKMNRPRHKSLSWQAVEGISFHGFPGTHRLWKLIK